MSFFQSSIINSSNMSSPSLPTVQSALTSAQQAMSGYTQNIQGSGTMPGMQSLASVIPSGLAANLQGTNSTATGSNPLGMMQGLGNNGNPLSSLSNIGSLNANLLPGNTRKPTGMPAKIQSAALSMDSGIKGFFSNIDNSIDSLFGQNQGKTAKSSVNAVTNSAQFQKGFMGQTAQGYKNSWNNIANATAVKTKTPDPISSSFKAAQKPPISTMVTLKSGTTGMSAMAIGTKTGNANNNIVGDQSTLAKRYGSDIVGGGNYSFRNASDSLFKSNAVSGMFSGLGNVLGSFGSVMGGATMGLNDVTSGVIGIGQHVINGGLGIFQDMMGDVAENVSGSVSGLNGFYDSGLPSVTDSQGNEVPGYSGTSYSTLMSYGGCMDQMGCMTNIGNMALMPYGAMGSAVNALQRILCEEGLFAPLGDLMNCVNMTKYNWENSRRYFYEFSGQDIGLTDVADMEQMFRLIESIPSKKAEPFKQWMAEVAAHRIDQMQDPELNFEQAYADYRRLGYSDKWINQRLKSIEVRKELTDEWDRAGVKEGQQYASLTDIITQAWSGKTTRQYKKYKGLKKESLRDNMTNIELALNILAEASTTEISKTQNPKGFKQSAAVARKGGKIAGDARKKLESQIGRSVISRDKASDYLPPSDRIQELPEGTED